MIQLEILKRITIDLSERNNPPVVYAVQGEKNSRKIRFDLFNNGVKLVIDRTASVLISYKKPDDHGGMYDVLDNGESAFEFAEDSTNSVIITLAEQVLTTIGRVPLLVSFMVEDEILSTFNIILDVSENPGIDVAESEDYFSLSAAIDAAKKVVGEMLDPKAFASKEYVDGSIRDIREELYEIADDARMFYVTISKSDDGSFAADKSVSVIRSAYDNGRAVKAVVDDIGEQVTIPLIGIIEDDTVMYVGYGANSNRIVISQTDILVSVHNDALPNVKTVNGTAPDENGNVTVPGGGSQNFSTVLTSDAAYKAITVPLPVNLGKALIFNVHVTFPSVETEFALIAVSGRCYMTWESKIPVNGKEVGANLYAVRHSEVRSNSGTTVAKDHTYLARPELGTAGWLDSSTMDNTLSIYSNTDGVDLPAGTKIEVWGICE